MNADRWLAPGRASRAGDTEAVINDAPTRVAWFRKGQSLGYLTVRVVIGNGVPRSGRSPQSASDTAVVTIVADEGTPLALDDTLQAEGGTVYAITFVHPRQEGRTSARAIVAAA